MTPGASTRDTITAASDAAVLTHARAQLLAAKNPDGGWPYRGGNASRLEATAWATLALGDAASLAVIARWPRADGWLVDLAQAPVNYPANALAAIALLTGQATTATADALADKIVRTRGKTFPRAAQLRQDNSIEAWPWVADTASWVEPTAWCLLLLKKQRARRPHADLDVRIAAGEALLRDRVCVNGGWNYGNPNVFGKDLWPYVPTTALALLALQDRPDHPVVRKSLTQMQDDLRSERSVLAMALALICQRVYGVAGDALRQQLLTRYITTTPKADGIDVLPIAMLSCALSTDAWRTFRLS